MTHAHGVQRVVAEQVEGAAVFAAKEDVVRAFRNIDTAQQLACGGVSKDLAGGQVDVAVSVLGQAFSALLDEGGDLR